MTRKRPSSSLAEPKTQAGNRIVTLWPDTVRALIRHRERMMQEGKAAHPYVFPSTTGKSIFKRALRDAFNRLIKTAGVKQIRFHDMRHTNASLLIANPGRSLAAQGLCGTCRHLPGCTPGP
jgi:integrase